MTSKVQGKGRGNQIAARLHSIRNVDEPMAVGTPSNTQACWKVAGEKEPESYTFHFARREHG